MNTIYDKTDNYGLNLYGDNDPADLRDGYNESMRTIDTTLETHLNRIEAVEARETHDEEVAKALLGDNAVDNATAAKTKWDKSSADAATAVSKAELAETQATANTRALVALNAETVEKANNLYNKINSQFFTAINIDKSKNTADQLTAMFANGGNFYIPKGNYSIDKKVKVNLTSDLCIISDGATFTLADNVDTGMFNFTNTNRQKNNITIVGVKINGNAVNNKLETNVLSSQIVLTDFNNVLLKDVCVENYVGFGVTHWGNKSVYGDRLTFRSLVSETSSNSRDGITGASENIYLTNIKGQTGDDLIGIAQNAPWGTSVNTRVKNVYVDNVFSEENTWRVIGVHLDKGDGIDTIYINNVHGSCVNCIYIGGLDRTYGDSNVRNISINNVFVEIKKNTGIDINGVNSNPINITNLYVFNTAVTCLKDDINTCVSIQSCDTTNVYLTNVSLISDFDNIANVFSGDSVHNVYVNNCSSNNTINKSFVLSMSKNLNAETNIYGANNQATGQYNISISADIKHTVNLYGYNWHINKLTNKKQNTHYVYNDKYIYATKSDYYQLQSTVITE